MTWYDPTTWSDQTSGSALSAIIMSALGFLGNQYQTPEQKDQNAINEERNAILREQIAAESRRAAEQVAAQRYIAELNAATQGKGYLNQAYGKAADTAIAGVNMNNAAIGNFLRAIRR